MYAIVEFGWVKTGSFNGLVPELLGRNTEKSTRNVNAHNPETDKPKHDVHGNCHVSDCKESLVQRQNREFNQGDAGGVDKGVGESDLPGGQFVSLILCFIYTYLKVDPTILGWDHGDVGPHSVEQN